MRRALIVGAGIGGLSAGIALRKAGWDIRIFERYPSPGELGFGLGLAPNAMAALHELGVGALVQARGFEPTTGEIRRMDGAVLKRVALPRGMLGGPMVMAMRPALHGALLDAVGADAITASAAATGFTLHGGRVTLHLANGDAVEGDLLVGADGVHSVIRRQLHRSEPPPRPSGIVSVRGGVDGAIAHLGGSDAVYYLAPGLESMFVRASATGIYWFIAIAQKLVPRARVRLKADTTTADTTTEDTTTEHTTAKANSTAAGLIAHMAPQFDDTFRAITGATSELRYDGVLVDRHPLPYWGTDVVTLVGDAAHPMLPHTGQGAAQAIVDAVTLGRMLSANVDVAATLRAFEAERQPKTAALVRQGRRTARFMGVTNPVVSLVREAMIRVVPVTTMARLYVRINRRAGTACPTRR